MNSDRLASVLAAIDAANAEDPNLEIDSQSGRSYPKELLYSHRMSERLAQFQPEASAALRIAVRAQHLQRWKIPRSDYNRDRAGYLQWRRKLGQFHAQRCAEIMAAAGCGNELIERVSDLLQKKNLRQDPEAQCLEDVACLVFIEFYLTDFAPQQDATKLIPIIQKTWNKMSSQGQSAALKLNLTTDAKTLIGNALQSAG